MEATCSQDREDPGPLPRLLLLPPSLLVKPFDIQHYILVFHTNIYHILCLTP